MTYALKNPISTVGEVGFMENQETPMEKHKRYEALAGEIRDYAETYGGLEAMYAYDIKTPQTLEKIIQKRGNGHNGKNLLVSKRSMYNTPQDYYDGVIQAIFNRVFAMQKEIDHCNSVIGQLRSENEDLKSQLCHRASLETVRQQKKMSGLIKLAEGIDVQSAPENR